jgi:hypothetical protein
MDKKISQLPDYPSASDVDLLPIVDTTNTTTKKITWANLKATLSTYFNTLYPSGSGTSTGTNTGDETTTTIKSKLGIATLLGSNTGDQDLSGYVTPSGTATLTNKTTIGLKVDGFQDTGGVKVIEVDANAAGVNYIVMKSASTGQAVIFQAAGSDTDVYFNLATKGAGTVRANGVNVATVSDTQALTNKDLSGAGNIFPPTTSLYRQALINGNFDVWQRGTSISLTGYSNTYLADRWQIQPINAGTYTFSQQDGTGVNGSNYCLRLQRNIGQTSTDGMVVKYSLETNTSIKLRGQTLTLSFWARCGANFSPASNTIIASILTGTGTDQSLYAGFTGQAIIANTGLPITTSWVKYSITSSVVGSTISQLGIQISATTVGTAGTNDYFEIAQVQLCAGAVALPFMPKSFSDELRDCQRYYEKSYIYSQAPLTASAAGYLTMYALGTTVDGSRMGYVKYNVPKRTSATVMVYPFSTPSNTFRVSDTGGTDLAVNSGTIGTNSEWGFNIMNTSGGNITTGNAIIFHYTASAEL